MRIHKQGRNIIHLTNSTKIEFGLPFKVNKAEKLGDVCDHCK